MKRLITLIALTIAAATITTTLSAKELSRNPDTGMTLSEHLGVYTITGKGGAIILGTKEDAIKFVSNANGTLFTEAINRVFNFGDDQFEVGRDDKGMYIIKVGLGAVKLRPSDTALFETVLLGKAAVDAGKKVVGKVKDFINK